MSLLQKAMETYDAHASLAGKVESASYAGADGKAVKACQPLAPIGHIITSADIEITLDGEGHFCQARGRQEGAKDHHSRDGGFCRKDQYSGCPSPLRAGGLSLWCR